MTFSQVFSDVRHLFFNVHPKNLEHLPVKMAAFARSKNEICPKNEVIRPKEEAKSLGNPAKLTARVVFEQPGSPAKFSEKIGEYK